MERFSEIPEFKKIPGEAELREAPEVEEYAESPETPLAKKENLDGFFEKEVPLQEKIGRVLDEITPKKLNNPIVNKTLRLLTAFSIFMGGSSFFAKGVSAEEIEQGLRQPKEAAAELLKTENQPKETEAPGGWKKFIDRFDISVGGIYENLPPFRGGVSSDISTFKNLTQSDFYKDFSRDKYSKAVIAFYNSVRLSDNSADFFQKLDQLKNFTTQQKTLILQNLGTVLNKTYNYDMLENNQMVKISDQAMFQSIKEYLQNGKILPGGICGNIHTFLTKAAKEMGLEAWLQINSRKRTNHIFSGLLTETDKGKQITFLDYNNLISTGTLNYKDALGIAERRMGSITTLNSFVGNETEFLFPVKSRAQEKIEEAAGVTDTGKELEEKLKEGKIKKEKGLTIKLSPETKTIGLTKDYIGLTFFNYENVYNNPYQSLENLNALRGRLNLKGETLSLEADATILHLNLKDLDDGNIAYDEFIGRIAADFIDSHKFNKGEYGQFILNYGASLQTALRLPLGKTAKESTAGLMGEGGTGLRMIYLAPNNIGKFYVGASEIFRGQPRDAQSKDIAVKEAAKSFTVGADIKVREGKILNLEAIKSRLDWGEKLEIRGGLAGEKWRGGLAYEKSSSRYERFIPSAEKTTVAVGYKDGPKWEIDVLGFKADEKYADAENRKIYGAEVKLKIFLW